MKLIITENQFKNIVENKLEKFKEKILQGVGDNGIYHTARELGMSTNDLIRQFGLELKDKKITDVIDFYMDNRFDKNYNFIEKGSLCESYGNSETFLNIVIETINEFCYVHFFDTHSNIDHDSIEFENVFYQMEYYIVNNYEGRIKNKFNEICVK